MELAVRYRHELNTSVAYELYGGPVGEPALGPTAFPHRMSAIPNPFAPLSHHWLDSTHISFGVVTGGLYGRRWKAEASAFNGREPDDNRYDFDFGPFDSYSGRFWLIPTDQWALQVSAGHLREADTPIGTALPKDVNRVTASATDHRLLSASGVWATTVAWGRNSSSADTPTSAVLAETNLTLVQRHTVFGRFEFNQKSGEDLVLPPSLSKTIANLLKVQGGDVYQLSSVGSLVPGIGASVDLSTVSDVFAPFYGGTHSAGVAVFVSLRPAAMKSMGNMPGMVH